MKVTDVYVKNAQAKTRIVANQGGRGSSKTYSILQLLISRAVKGVYKDQTVTIVRKTLAALRRTAFKDFKKILVTDGLFNPDNMRGVDMTYALNGCLFEFVGADDPDKLHGASRDVLYVNEVNDLTLTSWRELINRTPGQIFIDYNAKHEFHWVYDHVLNRDDCGFIQSTYLDNPELPQSIVDEIERYKDLDPVYWQVYGLGLRGKSVATIYTHWKDAAEIPESRKAIGIDFGFNVPSSIIELTEHERNLYVKELFYAKGKTNSDLIEWLEKNVKKSTNIYADSAEPDRIEEIRRKGFNIRKAKKDVQKGIDLVKSYPLYVHPDSVNLIKEIRYYKWKQNDNGDVLDDVVKENDHAMDAMRYAAMGLLNRSSGIGQGMIPNPLKR